MTVILVNLVARVQYPGIVQYFSSVQAHATRTASHRAKDKEVKNVVVVACMYVYESSVLQRIAPINL